MPALKPAAGADTGIADRAVGHEAVPDEQDDKGPDDGADESGALIDAIPADSMATERRQEGARDPEHGREDETRRIVGSGREEPGDQSRNEPDQDDPENMHGCLYRSSPKRNRARNVPVSARRAGDITHAQAPGTYRLLAAKPEHEPDML